MYLFLKTCRKSNNAWLRALMPSEYLCSSLFFEHYNRIFVTECLNIAVFSEICEVRYVTIYRICDT